MKTQQVNLFEHYDLQPEELKRVVDRWSNKIDRGLSYSEIEVFLREVVAVGYTFDYYLDAVPVCLHKCKQ